MAGEETAEVSPDSIVPEGPIEREHASDRVFRAIAAAILNKELRADVPLPPERELSERFGVSRIVVREAIHRLKEYELVRVRQGSPTMVLDPDQATDMRLLGLEIELMPPTPEGLWAFTERQIYSGAALLDLAEQRIDAEDIGTLEGLTEQIAARESFDDAWLELERSYWKIIAGATKNRLYLRETLWYFNLLARHPRFRAVYQFPPPIRAGAYRAINAAMRQRQGAAAIYLEMLRRSLALRR